MPENSGFAAGTYTHMAGARVGLAAKVIGGLAGKRVLELGRFEGYDAYTFEPLAATIVVSIVAPQPIWSAYGGQCPGHSAADVGNRQL